MATINFRGSGSPWSPDPMDRSPYDYPEFNAGGSDAEWDTPLDFHPPPGIQAPVTDDFGFGSGLTDTWPTAAPRPISNYWDDPLLQQYTDQAMQGIQQLLNMPGNYASGQAIRGLEDAYSSGKQGYADFQTIANRRLAQLKQPLFSTGGPINSPEAMKNSALLNTKLVEPMVQARDAAQKRMLDRAAARGWGQTSGLTEIGARGVDEEFNRNLANAYREAMLYETQANEGREQEAVSIGQMLAQLAANPAMISAASNLGNIGANQSAQASRDLQAAMGLSQNLAMLPMAQTQSVTGLLNSLNNQPFPQMDPNQGLIQMLLTMTNQGEAAKRLASQDEGNFWRQLFQAVPGLIDMIPKRQPKLGPE